MIPKVGQKMMLVPTVIEPEKPGSPAHNKKKACPCTVIYVNEAHRFFRVRFDMPHGSFTESYKFV